MDAAISLDTAAVVTDTSKRTLWRRIGDGSIRRCSSDERGRALLALDDLKAKLSVPFQQGADGNDYLLLIQADRGDSNSQADLALLFLEHDRADIALYWLELAAAQQHGDAMHLLSGLYRDGSAVKQCDSTALMWLLQAAAKGHSIARQQLAAVTGGVV